VLILYDHREEPGGVPGLLALAGIDLESAALPIADYIISDTVAIERKSAADFTASIKDGRLFDQARRMKEVFPSAVLLLEGAPSLPTKSIDGALVSLLRHGIGVLRVADETESAKMIERFAIQEAKPERPRAKGRRKDPLDPHRSALFSLAALPGVSLVKAERILEHFDTLEKAAQATPEDLQMVEGIGKKTALSIRECFLSGHKNSRPF